MCLRALPDYDDAADGDGTRVIFLPLQRGKKRKRRRRRRRSEKDMTTATAAVIKRGARKYRISALLAGNEAQALPLALLKKSGRRGRDSPAAKALLSLIAETACCRQVISLSPSLPLVPCLSLLHAHIRIHSSDTFLLSSPHAFGNRVSGTLPISPARRKREARRRLLIVRAAAAAALVAAVALGAIAWRYYSLRRSGDGGGWGGAETEGGGDNGAADLDAIVGGEGGGSDVSAGKAASGGVASARAPGVGLSR